MKLKSLLLRFRLVRVLALARKKSGALGQLGWLEINIPELAISGSRRVPWFTYGAIDFIDNFIGPELKVLELGGGSSTAFWVDRGNLVSTVETNPEWEAHIETVLAGHSNLTRLVGTGLESFNDLSDFEGVKFDVIVNDFDGGVGRENLNEWMVAHLEDSGFIIWDNSDRNVYRRAIDSLVDAGFREIVFFGLGPGNSYAWQTSILTKRFGSRNWSLPERASIRY